MSGSRRLVLTGVIAGILLIAAAGIALVLANAGRPATPNSSALGYGGYGMMGSGGYGMMGGGYGPAGTPGSGTTNPAAGATTRGSQAVTLNVRSDSEHGKLGPDGRWHDAFLPADFTVHPGYTMTVTVYNYDDMPHSFTSDALGVSQTIPGGSTSAPSQTTFTFTAPAKAGSYQWWCAVPCDPWAMAHDGYMRGHVTVTA